MRWCWDGYKSLCFIIPVGLVDRIGFINNIDDVSKRASNGPLKCFSWIFPIDKRMEFYLSGRRLDGRNGRWVGGLAFAYRMRLDLLWISLKLATVDGKISGKYFVFREKCLENSLLFSVFPRAFLVPNVAENSLSFSARIGCQSKATQWKPNTPMLDIWILMTFNHFGAELIIAFTINVL